MIDLIGILVKKTTHRNIFFNLLRALVRLSMNLLGRKFLKI
jgi:hypothetical protein